ncbi:MAG: FUSC family protein [Actinobacteria bacterium]|nr:MAG: FUSC family protein [Actinomycetota bacterium]
MIRQDRIALGVRASCLVALLAFVTLGIMHKPGITGVACLTGLLLVLADFPGDGIHRAKAYVGTGVAGVAALAAGHLAAHAPMVVFAVIIGLLAAGLFVLRGFGGAVAAGTSAVTSDLLVGASLGLHRSSFWQAVTGAVLGMAVAAGGALLVASPPRRTELQTATVHALGRCVAALSGGGPSDAAIGRDSEQLISLFMNSSDRTASPSRAAVASSAVVTSTARLMEFIADHGTRQVPLRDAVVACLSAAKRVVDHPRDQSAAEHLEHQARQLQGDLDARIGPRQGDDGYRGDAIVLTVLQIADYAATARGSHVPGSSRRTTFDSELWSQLKTRLRPDAPLMNNALAAFVLFGTLSLLVSIIHVPHPQWLLMGAMSSFYPYARRSAFVFGNVLLGTLIGLAFVVGLDALMGGLGKYGEAWGGWRTAVWWVALVVAVFVAAAAPKIGPGALVGQAAFTSLSLCLLAIADAQHFHASIAEERAFDVIVGGIGAMLTALLITPRHMRPRLAAGLADLCQSTAEVVRHGADSWIAHGTRMPPATIQQTRAQGLRCLDALEVIRGTRMVEPKLLLAWAQGLRHTSTMAIIAQAASLAPPPDHLDAPVLQDRAAATADRLSRRATQLREALPLTDAVATEDASQDTSWDAALTGIDELLVVQGHELARLNDSHRSVAPQPERAPAPAPAGPAGPAGAS